MSRALCLLLVTAALYCCCSSPVVALRESRKQLSPYLSPTSGPFPSTGDKELLPTSENLLLQLRGGLSLQVQAMSGKMIVIEELDPNSTVLDLKERLRQREGLEPQEQRLIVNGRHMRDQDKISSYNLSDKTVIHLVLRLRGGARSYEP